MHSSTTMEKIHQVNQLLLDEVDRICVKNGINYFLDAGTLLGAVRHQDFIPWDDDVDILFSRKDFNRFLAVAQNELSQDFELVLPGHIYKESFFDFIPKLVYKPSKVWTTTKERRFYGNKLAHISLDLFVYDSVSRFKILDKLQKLLLVVIYGLSMGHRYTIDFNMYSKIEKVGVMILSKIGKFIPIKILVNLYSHIAQLFDYQTESKKVYVSNYTFKWIFCLFDANWYKEKTVGKIRNHSYSIPAHYDDLLRKFYGDYMSLPPIEEQVPKHVEDKHVKIISKEINEG